MRNCKLILYMLVLSAVTLCNQQASAQVDTINNEVIAFHPFHLIQNGIRVDYDRNICRNHWIQIGPQFYVAERSNDNYYGDFKNLMGVGISAFHRIYLGKTQQPLGVYFSYGLTYNYFNLQYNDLPNNSITPKIAETTINKFGADIVIGYQTAVFDKLILDFYAGLGGRYSEKTYTGTQHRSFNEQMGDYGFTGNVIVLGIRLGFGF